MLRPRGRLHARWLSAAIAVAALLTVPAAASAAGQSFTFLQPGFSQELYGTQPSFMGGIAFAPDGDPIATDCSGAGSPLRRYDKQTLLPPFHGTSTLHPRTDIDSNAGCGITQAGGHLFSNTYGGVTKLDPDTGATLGIGGPSGNALGITVDPITQRLVYVGGDGRLWSIDQGLGAATLFSSALQGHFLDGIFFSPDGQYLFTADRGGGPSEALSIVARNGSLVQSVPVPTDPDGIAFHATSPKFVVSNNTDGTMTRYDFPGDDYTKPPTQSSFASGGGRGDITQVGNDGCLYVSQDNFTRYDDGTTDSNSSMVRICPGFAPAAGVEGPAGAANCSNGVDDDGDGKVDQADTDCQSAEGPPGSASCSDGVDNDNDGQTDAADSDCQSNSVAGRMATNATKDGAQYASIVDCSAAQANAKNRPFTVQWSDGGVTRRFTTSSYNSVTCFDDPSVPGNRPAGFDTQTGEALGKINGVSGYKLTWTASDGGTAANSDKIDLKITKVSDGSTEKTVNGTLAAGTAHSALPPA
jgi:hypothetical protein